MIDARHAEIEIAPHLNAERVELRIGRFDGGLASSRVVAGESKVSGEPSWG